MWIEGKMVWDVNERHEQVFRINMALETQADCDRLIRSIRIVQPLLSRRRVAVEADFGLPPEFGKLLEQHKRETALRSELAAALCL